MIIKGTNRAGKAVESGSTEDVMGKPLPFALQRILVPVDFSTASKEALQYALTFSSAFGAEVVLVHVVQVFAVPPDLGYLAPELPMSQQDLIESAQVELRKLCDREMAPYGRWQVSVRAGVAWQEIVTAARESDADLIIIATQGHTGLKHVLLGSVAECVVRHAPCPVLVVRERERDFVQPSDSVQERAMG